MDSTISNEQQTRIAERVVDEKIADFEVAMDELATLVDSAGDRIREVISVVKWPGKEMAHLRERAEPLVKSLRANPEVVVALAVVAGLVTGYAWRSQSRRSL